MTFIDEVVAIKSIMALVVRMSWAFRAGLPAYNTPICRGLLTTSVFLADCEKNVRLKKIRTVFKECKRPIRRQIIKLHCRER